MNVLSLDTVHSKLFIPQSEPEISTSVAQMGTFQRGLFKYYSQPYLYNIFFLKTCLSKTLAAQIWAIWPDYLITIIQFSLVLKLYEKERRSFDSADYSVIENKLIFLTLHYTIDLPSFGCG